MDIKVVTLIANNNYFYKLFIDNNKDTTMESKGKH